MRPTRRSNLCLSTERSCSAKINPRLPPKTNGTRYGACDPAVVMGDTITVSRASFSSSGETTTAGRVFLISRPIVGSSATSQTSPRITISVSRLLDLEMMARLRGAHRERRVAYLLLSSLRERACAACEELSRRPLPVAQPHHSGSAVRGGVLEE